MRLGQVTFKRENGIRPQIAYGGKQVGQHLAVLARHT